MIDVEQAVRTSLKTSLNRANDNLNGCSSIANGALVTVGNVMQRERIVALAVHMSKQAS